MARNWVLVSKAEAEQHKLYGRGGWLISFSIGIVLGPIFLLGAAGMAAGQAGRTLSEFFAIDHPLVTYMKLVLGIGAVSWVLMTWLFLSLSSAFRAGTIALMLAQWPAYAITATILHVENSVGLASAFVSCLFSCLFWVPYLSRSRRVRVTFERTVLEIPSSPAVKESNAVNPVIAINHPRVAGASSTRSQNQPVIADPMARDVVAAAVVAGSPAPAAIQVSAPSQPPALTRATNGSIDDAVKEKIWAYAFQEYDSSKRRPGLYARCYAASDGNEAAIKVAYLKCRVHELEHLYVDAQAKKEQKAKELRDAQAYATALGVRQVEQARWRAEAAAPRGRCPMCDDVIELSSKKCPYCQALLDENAAWKVIPAPPNVCARILCTKLLSKRAATPSDIIYVVKACASDPVLKDVSLGGSPLLALAAQRGLAREVEELLRLGANPLSRDKAGNLPRDLAQPYPEVQALFDRDWKAKGPVELPPFVE